MGNWDDFFIVLTDYQETDDRDADTTFRKQEVFECPVTQLRAGQEVAWVSRRSNPHYGNHAKVVCQSVDDDRIELHLYGRWGAGNYIDETPQTAILTHEQTNFHSMLRSFGRWDYAHTLCLEKKNDN